MFPNHLWQMDITHIAEFGKLEYVHMIVDTYSGFLMVPEQTGEATKHVVIHCFKMLCLHGNS